MKYENVDLIIERYFSYLPHGNSYFDTVPREFEYNEQYEIKDFLIEENIIEDWGDAGKHKLTRLGKEIVTVHKGIKNYIEFKQNEIQKVIDIKAFEEENIILQNQKLKFEETIRNQEQRIRDLEERNHFLNLLQKYWWVIVTSIGIGLGLAELLDIIIM